MNRPDYTIEIIYNTDPSYEPVTVEVRSYNNVEEFSGKALGPLLVKAGAWIKNN